METPSPLEQYMLELVNRARANPGAEANLHSTSLSSGQAGAKAPLAFTPDLLESSGDYSTRMINEDFFDHTAPDGSTMSQRIFDAGWTSASGGWSLGENISWYGSFSAGFAGQASTIDSQHRGLFRSSGHRSNILDQDYTEVGIGQVQGAFTSGSTTYPHTSMITQNFADGGRVFLTGVAIADADGDSFYDPGEGVGGVQISASSNAGTFDTATWSAGGYSLQLPNGLYQVTFSGGGLPSPVVESVRIAGENEKLDVILGESASDEIVGGAGSDSLVGTSAADRILGKSGNDRLFGEEGRDALFGAAGSDSLHGGQGSDSLFGGAGEDHLVGGSGTDSLFGGGSADFLNGGDGSDTLFGGAGKDTYAVDRPQDLVRESAGGGIDWVRAGGDYTLPEGGSQDYVEHLRLLGQNDSTGRGNDLGNSLVGNGGDNRLHGLKGDDDLFGRDGADILRGGGGGNRLYGGSGGDSLMLEGGDRAWGGDGQDRFFFDGDEGEDLFPVIADFSGVKLNSAEDRDRFVFSSGLESGDFSYRGSAAFQGEGDSQARFAGSARVEVDLDGDADADIAFKVNGLGQANQLTAADFLWLAD